MQDDKPIATDIIAVEQGRTVVVCADCNRTFASGPSGVRGIGVLFGHCGCKDVFQGPQSRALADSKGSEGEE